MDVGSTVQPAHIVHFAAFSGAPGVIMSLDILRQMGMTDQQIQEKLLDTIARKFLAENHHDVFDDEEDYSLAFQDNIDDLDEADRTKREQEIEALRREASMHKLLGTHLRKHFQRMFASAVSTMGTNVVLPILQEMISQKVFQKTNKWGERTGESQTVMEFLEAQCKGYLLEDVDAKGRTKEELGQYDSREWKSAGKRIDVIVQNECTNQVREVVKNATAAATKAVGEAYREKINVAVSMAIDSVKIEVKK